jgi:hypothetical protein
MQDFPSHPALNGYLWAHPPNPPLQPTAAREIGCSLADLASARGG